MPAPRLRRATHGELRAGLDCPLPDPLIVGRGTALALTGWCVHPRRAIRRIEMMCGETVLPAALHGIQRRDLRERGISEWSGFAAVVPIERVSDATTLDLYLRAVLAGGRCETAELGSLRVQRDGQSSFTPLTPHPLSRVPASPPKWRRGAKISFRAR